MKCVSCLQGLTWECRREGKCDEPEFDSIALAALDGAPGIAIGSLSGNSETGGEGDSSGPFGEDPDPDEFTTYKDDSALRDQQSTGRKRAAKLFPLDPEAPCEWKLKKNAGGGNLPIIGCLNGKQQARHHGPDKNTLNNERGNVHRICHVCHNRWHTLNDPGYVWEGPHEFHAPIEATLEEIALNEVFWDGRKLSKPEH